MVCGRTEWSGTRHTIEDEISEFCVQAGAPRSCPWTSRTPSQGPLYRPRGYRA